MRFHTDNLTEAHVQAAARKAGCTVTIRTHQSRSRKRGLDFALSGSGGTGWKPAGPRCATWDEWGIALGELFRLDPDAFVKGVYESGEHYGWVTGHRFTPTFGPADQHRRHKWEFAGLACTGSYRMFECKCGAVQRGMYVGTFADLTASMGA